MPGVYIHIPFCEKRCSYCDFYFITNTKLLPHFLNSLRKEIELSAPGYTGEVFDTVYFGGGTPSLVSPQQLNEILNMLKSNLNISPNAEITIEANPEDFADNKFGKIKEAGINRISFGVQSFRDDELKFLTRNHTAFEAENVIKGAVSEIGNVNLDIIYSVPGQTAEDLEFSLEKASSLGVPHISAYTLTYEEKTPLFKLYEQGKILKNTTETEAEFYAYTAQSLIAKGYLHYEVSNFAKPGYESKHNLKYWQYEDYLGLGPSAHSLFYGKRWNNFKDTVKYNLYLSEGKLPHENLQTLEEKEKKFEFILVSLRSKGVDIKKYNSLFKSDFRNDYDNAVQELTKNEFAVVKNDFFSLKEKGYAVSDEIMARYF